MSGMLEDTAGTNSHDPNLTPANLSGDFQAWLGHSPRLSLDLTTRLFQSLGQSLQKTKKNAAA